MTSEIAQICPYTGLRSFSEDESLYFKGRDLQVEQITSLLERNKFLMVTGASGEGKSSLIYAGIIPNARAGFFKARYANWVVADFRPERSPVSNMAEALADKFSLQKGTIETELRRGFSSLVDLYSNSDFYTDEEDTHWKQLSDDEKKTKKRKAANLLILVDQFEEFFTNPENFYNESPSQDSQIVVNLILETARIAMKRNLPIYVVCTMRSDYIGQCSAFRGLPEYIGFSQFFVPRLKRKDLKQVIEEPALLSGNRISQRLIERLVYDIAEGVDQLPILQHALSQIWLSANSGNDEMDLIHYAMVGGMPANELPDEERENFSSWFNALPESQRAHYAEPSLSKVIEIHASLLYENAWAYYNKSHQESPITQQEAKRIIALAFSCLTKIDNGRAVRNRMTLGEITSIINLPRFSEGVVSNVLNIFREEGNSFLRPFLVDGSPLQLPSTTVLDITHESLIRNWNKLNKWANQEFEFYSTYLDFKKQLDRWKKSKKSSGYLLPIGPLSYFEHWYNQCKPNIGWIQRYSEVSDNPDRATADPNEILADTREFLKRSARNVIVTRAFMKYGPQRIATVVALFIMLVLTAFYGYDAERKTNASVLNQIHEDAKEILKSRDIDDRLKSDYLLVDERYKSGTLIPYLRQQDYKNRVELAIASYKSIQYFNKRYPGPLKLELIEMLAADLKAPPANTALNFQVEYANKFLVILLRDNYYEATAEKAAIIAELNDLNRGRVLTFFRDKSLFRPGVSIELNMALQLWYTAGTVTKEKVQDLINAISPLAGTEAEHSFNIYYPKGSFEPNGRRANDYYNGYHTLASLYAVQGDIAGIEWSFNKILETGQRDYFELGRMFNNHLSLFGYLYQFHHPELVPQFLKWISANTNDNPPITVYRNVINRAGYISRVYLGANQDKNLLRSYSGYLYPNLCLADRKDFDAIVADYEKLIHALPNEAERNYEMAINCKRKAMYMAKYWHDRNAPLDESKLDAWLDEAVNYYLKIPRPYLDGTVSTTTPYWLDGVRTNEVTRQSLFIYPDYRDGWFSEVWHTDYFFQYLNKKRLLPTLFKTAEDLQAIHLWATKAIALDPRGPRLMFYNSYYIPDKTLSDILSFVDHHPQGKEFDKNLFLATLANRAFEQGDTTAALNWYRQFDPATIDRSSDKYEYLEKTHFLNTINTLAVHLAEFGKFREAVQLAEQFPKDEFKVFTYIFMAEKMYKKDGNPLAFACLDSVYSISRKIDFTQLPFNLDSRPNLILLLSRIGSQKINNMAIQLVREYPENDKTSALFALVQGVANEGNFYRAYSSIPTTLSERDDLVCRVAIMIEACRKQEQQTGNNPLTSMDEVFDWQWYYVYYTGT